MDMEMAQLLIEELSRIASTMQSASIRNADAAEKMLLASQRNLEAESLRRDSVEREAAIAETNAQTAGMMYNASLQIQDAVSRMPRSY